jgi:hypothetical protein
MENLIRNGHRFRTACGHSTSTDNQKGRELSAAGRSEGRQAVRVGWRDGGVGAGRLSELVYLDTVVRHVFQVEALEPGAVRHLVL